jgi:hypothetical protein
MKFHGNFKKKANEITSLLLSLSKTIFFYFFSKREIRSRRREDKNKLLKNLWLVNRRLGWLDVCVSAVHANLNAYICAILF